MKHLKKFESFGDNLEFNEHDTVRSIEEINNIPIGTEGTIVHIYNDYVLAVEFFDEDHNTISVETVRKTEIEKIN